MKTKFILSFAGFAMTLCSYSQIKIFSGGGVSYGSTTVPGYGEKHHFTGDVMISANPTLNNSAIYMRGNNGYSGATNPDYTFAGDNQTGIFHPAANVLGLTISGSEKFRLNSSNQFLSVNTTSSASTPDFSWSNDANTGVFHPGNDILGFTTGGAERMRLSNNGNLIIGSTSDLGARFSVTGGSNQGVHTNNASHTSDWGYCQVNHVNRSNTKAIAVISSATGSEVENFVVLGWGGVYSNGYYSISDKTMKENIDSLQNSMDKIKQLKGVKYNLKQSLTGPVTIKTEIGLLAQDVEAVVPEVVMTNDKGIKCIAYQNLVPLLIEALKEQDKQIIQLKNDVTSCCTQSNPKNNRLNSAENNTGESYNGSSFIKQNVPNPFNKETIIEYFVAEKSAAASILVFDMSGKLLKTYKLNGTGQGNLTINGNDLAPGMYYYSLIINAKEVGTKKMILTE